MESCEVVHPGYEHRCTFPQGHGQVEVIDPWEVDPERGMYMDHGDPERGAWWNGGEVDGYWGEAWMVAQSHVDPRVWVPLQHDSDMSGIYLSGGIRAVKKAVEGRYNGTTEKFRWRKAGDGLWYFDIWVDS